VILICTPKIWKKDLIARLWRSCAQIRRPQFCRREREREREREKFCREFQVSNVEQICLREQEIVDKEKVFSTSLDPEIFC
jgi:hypothetical protein